MKKVLLTLFFCIVTAAVITAGMVKYSESQSATMAFAQNVARDVELPDSIDAESGYSPERLLPPLRPITEFETRSVEEVGDDLFPSELVLAVTIDGQARAYPINMLTGPQREIINDRLGNRAIGATW